MPQRIDSDNMNQTARRDLVPNERYDPYRRQSPPSIGQIVTSPALSNSSVDRSALSTSPPRRHTPHDAMQSPLYSNGTYHSEPPLMHNSRSLQSPQYSPRGTHMYPSPGYSYDNRYDPNEPQDHTHFHISSPVTNSHLSNMNHSPTGAARDGYGVSYPLPGQNNHAIVYTDDAATKLSDKVRRRCFNCFTTDTSTWRRSNLSPGKVLCNKCGLFERTHSRPRPEQFPHKRGPLASSTLSSRTPPQVAQASQSAQPPQPHMLPPYHYNHPSVAPLASVPEPSSSSKRAYALPEIQTWMAESGDHALAHQAPSSSRRAHQAEASSHHARPSTPHRVQNSPAQTREA